MLESRKERVRHLYYEEAKNTREIARIERISIRDISAIIKEEEARRQSHEDDSHKQLEGKIAAAAYSLFNQGKKPVEVAIELKLTEPPVSRLHKEYLHLQGLSDVALLCEKIGEDAWAYLDLYQLCNSSGMSNKEIVKAVDSALNKLPLADENYFKTREKVKELAETEQLLLHSNKVLKAKSFSLAREISDLETKKHELLEYCKSVQQKIEEFRMEQQQIQDTMNKYQYGMICNFAGAIYIVLNNFLADLARAIEIREMYKGDIA